ncbi:MAG TPA: hypothetical protein VE959_33610 [Bryobacteraceae bacterium]|nr:hypothetical protein [Bryobacteraceae bacterium]
MSNGADLFQLLPAVYRLRDAAQGGPLENLVAIFQDVLDSVDRDVSALYENWFIETCAEWVVPYIGDLLGSRPLYAAGQGTFSARAYVAHTLAYRRRKGTVVVLEQLARDVTGWPARAVEFFQLLATTQYLNHLRPGNLITPDLRDTNSLELIGGPFEQASRTADVRAIVDPPLDPALAADVIDDTLRVRGKYNIPNVGLFLWRLQSYAVTLSTPRPVTDGTDGRYWFHPMGLDEPLFNQPQTLAPFTRVADEIDVPGELRRRALYDELETRRQTMVDNNLVWLPSTPFPVGAEIVDSNGNTEKAVAGGTSGGAPPVWPTTVGGQVPDNGITWQLVAKGFALGGAYFAAAPVLQIFPASAAQPVPPEQIMICDLRDLPPPAPPGTWRQPPASKVYTRASDQAQVSMPIQVSVDPVLGRLAFAAGSIPAEPPQVQVSYSYGFSGDLGGGPYNRIDSVSPLLAGISPWQVAVSQEVAPIPGLVFATLTDAVNAWNALPSVPQRFGVIAILDSHTYQESLTGASHIVVPEGSTLLIVAADWPALRQAGAPQSFELVPNGVRPHLLGDMAVEGTAPPASFDPGTLIVNGLWIEGGLEVLPGNLGGLQLVHSTLDPQAAGLSVDPSGNPDLENSPLNITIQRSICGPIDVPDTVPSLSMVDSIVDAGTGVAIRAPGSDANIQSSTIFGTVGNATASGVRTLQAGNSIFLDLVNVERTQAGCVRFCYVPSDISRTPRRYRCQPDLALTGIIDPAVEAGIRGRLGPLFTSIVYGDPGYAQLSAACAKEIRAGADNGAEMGAFYFLEQPQRDSNLRIALLEYLRFGLQAGIFYVT